ncbi:hypothetical protein B9N43_12780 [Denitratisoma sp. DHT3]|nr:hypothetical protein B9N43_12780 [Denitratisoma sp. DHT3]
MSFSLSEPMTASAGAPPPVSKVAILMGTCQGASFLAEQLASIERQTLVDWCLVASDDASEDDTWTLLEDFQRRHPTGKVLLRHGPGAGFACNFLSLAWQPGVRARHYAFADQDDVWEAEKLARALAWLDSVPAEVPALYGGRTRLIDAAGRELGLSPEFRNAPCFSNALVQSIAGGNTMVFNEAARALLAHYEAVPHTVSHDWWIYQAVTACGGVVRYDPTPTVRYRQHAANLIGSNRGFGNGMSRLCRLWEGGFHAWMDCNLEALSILRPRMTEANRAVLDEFMRARVAADPLARLRHGLRSGVHRQTWPGTLALRLALAMGKV